MAEVKELKNATKSPQELTLKLTKEEVTTLNNVIAAGIREFSSNRADVAAIVNMENKLGKIIAPFIEQPNGDN